MTHKPQADAIIDGTIVNADIASSAAIAPSKLNPQLLLGISPDRLVMGGHSYVSGTGAVNTAGTADPKYAFAQLLRTALSVRSNGFTNLGTSGSVAFRTGQGTILQGIAPSRTAGPAVALAGAYCHLIGLNDIAQSFVGGLPDTAAGYKTWKAAISSYILRPLQCHVIEDNDAGWTYSGTSASSATTAYSGTSVRAWSDHTTAASGSYTLPSWFDGDYVHVSLIGAISAPTSVAIKVGGVTATTVDMSGIGGNNLDAGQEVAQLHRVAATGGQVVSIEVAAGGGGGGFLKIDHLGLEAKPRPLVLFANINRLPGYGSFWTGITDAMIANFNAQTAAFITALGVAEVVYVDIDAALAKAPANFTGGGTTDPHPNNRGHSIIAQSFLDALLTADVELTALTAGGLTALGSMATQDAATVAITGGTVTGITDLAVADGGTGASTAAAARTNLGLGTLATLSTTPVTIGIAVSDETTALTTGVAKVTVRMPHAMTLTAVRSSVNTVSSSGLVTVDINEAGVSVLSTTLSIDASEKTSTTAATAAVISDTALADDAEITIDIDAAGTGAKGLKVWLIGTRAWP